MLQTLQHIRKLSTGSASRQLFVVVAKDHPGNEGLQRRLSVRGEHFEKANKDFEQGIIKSGGALLDSPKNGKMIGSLMIVEAESIEKARTYIESDIYVRGGVWKSWEIYPYKAALGTK